jgi:chromosome segregation ATPase
VVDQKNFEIGKLKDQASLLEGKIEKGENDLTALQTELEKVQAETSKLLDEIKVKDAAIQKLENNVKLLKTEIGG